MSAMLVLFAIAVGLVSAGLLGSLWTLVFEEEPQLGLLLDAEPTLLTPLRALSVVFAAPSTIAEKALWWLVAEPMLGVPLMALAVGWSFLQGVFILTQVFGFK